MLTTDIFVRHFLAIYFILVGIHYAVRSYALSERTGFSHIGYGKRYSRGWWHRHIFNLFRVLILFVCLVRLVADVDQWLGVIQSLYQPWVLGLGVLLMLLSFAVIEYVHSYMHQDWRTGIVAPKANQQLIVSGPFSRSRNPLFIGIITGQIGFFLAIPSLFSLLCLVVGVVVVINQTRSEEAALKSQFGESYVTYLNNVPRWL